MYCTNCRTTAPAGTRFCRSCGSQLVSDPPPATQQPPVVAPQPQPGYGPSAGPGPAQVAPPFAGPAHQGAPFGANRVRRGLGQAPFVLAGIGLLLVSIPYFYDAASRSYYYSSASRYIGLCQAFGWVLVGIGVLIAGASFAASRY